MLFRTEADQIEQLDSTGLVRLMKRLLLAECRTTGIPLRGAHVPLQVTVADGGEDGRVEWSGGVEQTAYLPSRFNVLQSKAQKLTEAQVRKEILKDPKKGKSGPPSRLGDAVGQALARGGSYIVFCREPMVGAKRDRLVKAIRDAITEAGEDPAKLAAIEVYDANTIADWTTLHPAVALWLTSQGRGRSVLGLQTHQDWGAAPEIAKVPWQEDEVPRFSLATLSPSSTVGNVASGWTALEAIRATRDHLDRDGAVVRVAGPSGYGKSRFAFEALSGRSGWLADETNAADIVYMDSLVPAENIRNLALEMASARASAMLVVDDCPDELHLRLAQVVQRAGSRLRLLTIDAETDVTVGDEAFLYVQVGRSNDALIRAIAEGVSPGLGPADASFIADLAAGFPRMAVLAAEQGADGRNALRSIEQVINRVVWGARTAIPDARRALEIASLFEWFGVAGDHRAHVEWIAGHVADMTGDEFAAHVLSFVPRGVVARRGDLVQVGPIPLAARLGARSLAVMSPDRLAELYAEAPPELRSSLLVRMKWLDTSPTAGQFARRLLAPDAMGNLAALGTDAGAEVLHRLLHVDPEAASAAIARVFLPLSLDELAGVKSARRHLVWCLEALAFRGSSFGPAATLLRRLAAVESERYGNNATGCFAGLFKLYLSGTEVPPAERLLVLDDGLASRDVRERRVCVEALGKMVETAHFSRFGGGEQLGSAGPLRDWQPGTGEEVVGFYSEAVSRLVALSGGDDELATRARTLLAGALRGLLNVVPFGIVEAATSELARREAGRIDALRGLSAWLFFDRQEGEGDLGPKVRELYARTLPTDVPALLRVYTSGWQTDLHDPDKSYGRPEDRGDHDFSIRQSRAIARQIAGDANLSRAAVEALAISRDHTAAPFAEELMGNGPEPKPLFQAAVEAVERSGAAPNLGLFGGLIQGAGKRGRELAQDLVGAALRSPPLKAHAWRLIHAGEIGPDEVALVVGLLRDGAMTPAEAGHLSYGQGLARLTDAELRPLFDELQGRGGEGLWAVLGIMQMVLYGGKPPSRDQLALLKSVLVRPELTRSARDGSDGVCLEAAVEKAIAARTPGKRFVGAVTRNLLRICQPGDGQAFQLLDGPVRHALSALARRHPSIVWEELMKRLESRSGIVRHFAGRLLSSGLKEDALARGLDVEIAPPVYLAWVRDMPEARASKAVAWLPIAEGKDDQGWRWHPELLAFLDEFATFPGVLEALRRRLFPSFYWGSMVPHLERAVRLVETWRTHPNPSLRAFADETRHLLREQIAVERKREEERSLRFG